MTALEAHRLAPPDSAFAQRLAAFAQAAGDFADVCREAQSAGYDWEPNPHAGQPPYELRPGTGRRGPHELWQRFDPAVEQLTEVTLGHDMLAVARAYDELAGIASELADAIQQEERPRSGRTPARARRSA